MKNVLSRISIRTRMAGILVAFLVPVGILSYQLGLKLQEDITFAHKEIDGNTYLKPVLTLLNEVADYEVLSKLAKHGSAEAAQGLNESSAAVEKTLSDLAGLETTYRDALSLTAEKVAAAKAGPIMVSDLRSEWQAMKDDPSSARSEALLGHLGGLVAYVGNTSNLILDPELDTYYLGDVTLTAAPQMLMGLADIKRTTLSALEKGNGLILAEDHPMLESLTALYKKVYVPKVETDIHTALTEDANNNGVSDSLQKNLPVVFNEFSSDAAVLSAALDSLLAGGQMTGEKFISVADKSHDGISGLAAIAADEMDKMLEMRVAALRSAEMKALVICGIGVLFAFALFVAISNSIVRPVRAITGVMEALSAGNTDVGLPNSARQDEIGVMMKTVAFFRDNLIEQKKMRDAQERMKADAEVEKRKAMQALADSFEVGVKGVVDSVASAATEMDSTARDVMSQSEASGKKTDGLMNGITTATQNVQTVASAAAELSASIGEINSQVSRSTRITAAAVQEGQRANATAEGLNEAAQKIGNIINVINEIAGQINLLALNATIEAARAGEAGKGFAVVASEVKNLASQTTKATQEVEGQIAMIQTAAGETVSVIQQITGTISEINNISSAIAAAVEEQGAATQEIARNVQQASDVMGGVSGDASEVRKSAVSTTTASTQMVGAAAELSRQSENLRNQVGGFLKNVRSA